MFDDFWNIGYIIKLDDECVDNAKGGRRRLRIKRNFDLFSRVGECRDCFVAA